MICVRQQRGCVARELGFPVEEGRGRENDDGGMA